jgi:hypothetical protein
MSCGRCGFRRTKCFWSGTPRVPRAFEYRVDNVINWRGGAFTEEEMQWQKMTPDIMVLNTTPDLDHVPLQKIVNRFV